MRSRLLQLTLDSRAANGVATLACPFVSSSFLGKNSPVLTFCQCEIKPRDVATHPACLPAASTTAAANETQRVKGGRENHWGKSWCELNHRNWGWRLSPSAPINGQGWGWRVGGWGRGGRGAVHASLPASPAGGQIGELCIHVRGATPPDC